MTYRPSASYFCNMCYLNSIYSIYIYIYILVGKLIWVFPLSHGESPPASQRTAWVVGPKPRYAIAMSFVGRPKDHMLPYIKSMEAAAQNGKQCWPADGHAKIPTASTWQYLFIWNGCIGRGSESEFWFYGLRVLPSFNKLVAKHGRKQTQWTPQKIRIAHMVAKIWLFGIVWYVLETITLWWKIWTAALVFLLPTRDPLILFLSLFIASVSGKLV